MSAPDTGKDFVISRTFDAPRALVFVAWTDPRHMARWWGPRICTCPVCEMDVRPGGAYRITMRMPDGVDYPVTGVFREIVKPERLVMTMDCTEHPAAWHDMVKSGRGENEKNPAGVMVMTATFDEIDRKTTLTVRIRFDTAEIRDALVKMGMNEGWLQSLDRLEENLHLDKVSATATSDREIVTTRIFNAPRELVWEAWTDPEKIVKWWGPDGFTNTIEVMDVRPGGKWKHILRGPDGKEYPNLCTYVEIVKPEKLSFQHDSWPNHFSTAIFEDLGGRTRVTLRALFESAERRDAVVKQHNAIEGAKQTLGRLAGLLAKG